MNVYLEGKGLSRATMYLRIKSIISRAMTEGMLDRDAVGCHLLSLRSRKNRPYLPKVA